MPIYERLNSKTDIINQLKELEKPYFQDIVMNIKSGHFIRNKNSPNYQDRLTYTEELRNFVYDPGILNLIFTDDQLKAFFFKTFGYRGQMDFTIYPNCWLRDIPLLDFGKNVYLGDGILLGTNQIDIDQSKIRVGKIHIQDNTIFDQKCAIGLNTTIGKNCIMAYHVSIGLKCQVGNHVKIEASSIIGHGTKIGDNVHIRAQCNIGNFVVIDEGVTLPNFSNIPAFSNVTQEGVFSRRKELVAAKN